MTPITFGKRDRFLAGFYDAPASGGRDLGVVIASSFGQEAMRAQRALRQLALELARAKVHVLRFDFFGTGDSAGEGWEGTTAAWIENLEAASEELKDTAGVSRIAWVGLRWGAVVALKASAQRSDLECVVALDPILDGPTYLDDLRHLHVEFLKNDMGPTFRPGPRGLHEEFAGFPIGDGLLDEIRQYHVERLESTRAKRLGAVVSAPSAETKRLASALRRLDPNAAVDEIHSLVEWNTEEAMTSALVPGDVIAAVVARVTNGTKRWSERP